MTNKDTIKNIFSEVKEWNTINSFGEIIKYKFCGIQSYPSKVPYIGVSLENPTKKDCKYEYRNIILDRTEDVKELFKQYFTNFEHIKELEQKILDLKKSPKGNNGFFKGLVSIDIDYFENNELRNLKNNYKKHLSIWINSGKDPIEYISETKKYIDKFGKK